MMDWKVVVEHLRATALDEPPGAMMGETALPVLYAADFIERNAAMLLALEAFEATVLKRPRGSIGWAADELVNGRGAVHPLPSSSIVLADFIRMLPDGAEKGWLAGDTGESDQ